MPARRSRWPRLGSALRYLTQTEAHVYGLAFAASALLSFYPFVLVMLSFCHNVLHWRAAEAAIYLALDDSLPGDLGAFIRRNLPRPGSVEVVSMLLLLCTANGVFVPLEVAFNRAWGVARNRSYLLNQAVALGMIFLCGGLALLSLMFTAMDPGWLSAWPVTRGATPAFVRLLLFKLAAVPLSILALFFLYWLLPNCKIRPARVAPAAIVVGLTLEALKYADLLLFPLFRENLAREYGVFQHSALILLWSFAASLVILAGAYGSAHGAASESAHGAASQSTGADPVS